MNSVVVGVADCRISADRESVVVTYALGSCIAVIIHDPVAGVGGLLHYMLPESSLDRQKAQQNPYMFADTGIPKLFHAAYEMGADKRRLTVMVTGGAQVMDAAGVFNIGKRNHLAVRKILWKAGVMVHAEEVGGSQSRTVRLEISTGRVLIRGAGEDERVLASSPQSKKGVGGGV